ncbi:MAG: NAD(P)/FAD-dependent oxidoreductase [Candidatus Peregrinibacteria bacterium]|nr:NAD(P)/FAD-dependent oxidoreductase [Candidatus Peregrinibacteria bacterium]
MNYDVVIVGASFSGLTLAHHLPKNLKVLVLDMKKNLDAYIESTGLITQATYDLLAEFVNVGAYIPNKIVAIGVIGTDFNRNFFSYSDAPWIYSTDTPQLVKHMSDTLPENVTLSVNSKFTDYKIDKNNDYSLEVFFSKNGQEQIVRSRFIVGADGAKSSVAKSNKSLSQNKKFLIGLEKVFYGNILLGPNPDKTVYHYWFGEFSLGYGGWLSPTVIKGKKAFRLGLAKLSENANEFGEIKDFVEMLKNKKMIRIEDSTEEILTFASMIPIGGPLKNVCDDYSLLIGDAAGLCGAFAADGIKGSVVSGKVAAKLITAYLNGEKNALKKYHVEIQKYNKLMTYYKKQMLYRWLWDRMKSNRTFDTMFDIISRSKEDFLNQFCDSKDRHKSLLSIVLKISNVPLLLKYSWYLFLDLFKMSEKGI